MGYIVELEEELLMLLPGLLSGIPSGLFGVAAYILTALAIYRISVRRGLQHPWFAWVPVVNCWLLGSISDQYQYVVKGENKSKRKWLISLNILKAVLWLLVIILAIVAAGMLIVDGSAEIIGLLVAFLGLLLPFVAVIIAFCVIRYMALFDVYRSLDPSNAVMYLVLSILFSPTEPFFLFFNREKDLGMPPRKQKPVQEETPAQDYEYETVETTEYL